MRQLQEILSPQDLDIRQERPEKPIAGVKSDMGVLANCLTHQQLKKEWIHRRRNFADTSSDWQVDDFLHNLDTLFHRISNQIPLDPTDIELGCVFLDAVDPDLVIIVGGEEFPCHKSFIFRCEYFQALLSGRFKESLPESSDGLNCVSLSLTTNLAIVPIILHYLYADRYVGLNNNPQFMLELLEVADLLLLDHLKGACVTQLLQIPEAELNNKPALLRAAWIMNLQKLEEHVTKCYARIFDEKLTEDEDFIELILESADSVIDRQEEDTIIFVDDLMFWITHFYKQAGDAVSGLAYVKGTLGAIQAEYDKKMSLLDGLMKKLGMKLVNTSGS
ncbi:Ankyrin repeat and BTB/POZ domain-containing protein 1 [Entophlyctis sp. JEL0112]|nr:Ankyrin repeat and BTB/POZ domain-containing protein 1 [Entophlyctis sp. JEL0112]